MTTAPEAWTCPTCNVAVPSRFCPACGEHLLRERDLTLAGLVEQAVQAFTDVDGRLIRSVIFLVNRPGMLTLAYLRGQRLPYIGPFALFLLANVIFLAMESLTNSHVFSAPLQAHLHSQPWSPFAAQLVAQHVEAAQTTLGQFAPDFDRAVALNARSLVILMVLPFAVLLPLMFYGKRLPFAAHVVFSLHFLAFLLLSISFALVVPAVDAFVGGPGLASQAMDDAIALVLVVAAAAIVLGYRFFLLLLTLSFM